MRNGNSWQRWLAGATVAVLVVLTVITLLPLSGENGLQDSANTAQLTGYFVAAGTAAVVAVVWAWRATRPRGATLTADRLNQAKEALAGAVTEQWRREERLRSLGPEPIPVLWCTPAQAEPALVDHPANIVAVGRAQWTASSADVGALVKQLRRSRRRRLVLIGGPGTGKTTLAMQLLLHLLASRSEHPGEPVPVLLPIADWDIAKFPQLQDWLAVRLASDYPTLRSDSVGDDVARALARRGCVMPVLDGLDELSPQAQTKVITALNDSLGDEDQLILTSRTTEFITAVKASGRVVHSAAVLEALPLDTSAAADYLRSYLPPSPGQAWEDVFATLRHMPSPGQVPPDSVERQAAALADVTTSPLGLWLLRTVYTAPEADPTDLIDPDHFPSGEALWDHLFDRLIPVVIKTRQPSDNNIADPFRPRKHHDPDDARRWLSHLAYHLTYPTHADGSPRTRDFRWWRLARDGLAQPPTIKLLSGLTSGVLGALSAGMVAKPSYALTMGLVLGINSVARGGYSIRAWSHDKPGLINLRLRGRIGELARHLALGLGAWFPLCLALGLLLGLTDIGLTFGLAFGVVFGLVRGLTFGLGHWMEVPAATAAARTPLSSWQADRRLNFVRVLVLGFGYGLAFAVVAGVRHGPIAGLLFGLAAVIPFGFLAGGGLGTGSHRAWLAYKIATRHLARQQLLPRDLMGFLDDAHRLGLLRAVGPVYQFRHSELQDRLATEYTPAS